MQAPLPAGMIRDTVAAVFRDPDYNRFSLIERIWSWLSDVLQALFMRLGPGRVPVSVFWLMVALIGTALVLLLARALLPLMLQRQAKRARRAEASGATGRDGDLWADARLHAAHGDYTAAAHALYGALLQVIAGKGALELHESKTIGDYLRELAHRSSALRPRFRDFARSYELVIYGIGSCDRDEYERLHGLALRVVQSGG
jgi:hypothetical protein